MSLALLLLMKRKTLDCYEDKTPHPKYILPPKTKGLECDKECPQLLYSRKGLDSLYAHCMRYYVPLSAQSGGPFTDIILRHTTCRKEYPEVPPPLPKEAP